MEILPSKEQLNLFGYEEYFNSFVKIYNKKKLPNVLLINGPKGTGKSTDKIYTTGCFIKFENFIIDNAAVTAGVGVGIIFLLLLGISVSCCVARGLASRNSYERLV